MSTPYVSPRLSTAIALLFGAALVAPPAFAQPEPQGGCDCSCEAFQEFVSTMEARTSGGNMAQMNEAAACYGQCIQQWQQCQAQLTAEERAAGERSEEKGEADDEEPYAYLGEPREDLERFYGEYRSSEIGWIVGPAEASFEMRDRAGGAEIPDGHMMIYATRGDVAPYYPASVADTQFESNMSGPVEFEVDAEGQAIAMTMRDDRYERVSTTYPQSGSADQPTAARSGGPPRRTGTSREHGRSGEEEGRGRDDRQGDRRGEGRGRRKSPRLAVRQLSGTIPPTPRGRQPSASQRRNRNSCMPFASSRARSTPNGLMIRPSASGE